MGEVKLTHRQRQALETRSLIARTARDLFTERGYATTSLEAVAEAAGVAPRTIYAAFGNKKAILAAICDGWLAEAGVVEEIRAAAGLGSLAERLASVARASRRQWESERGLVGLLTAAAASDAEVARMLATWRGERARAFRSVLAGVEDQLREGVAADTAGALLRALTGADVYTELVAGEGWSPAHYERWLRQLLEGLLLPAAT